ncbi:hypothetical protein [Winogradskyella psychrotolerans]|uniref:hypothetical protein n=1 Tax=Winogradskyella psychrotolerans TaxID=1344585 RepID=UPI001C0706F1|nr:hypothetical protein [Winogradskyella psychrotolerans]MBU2928152.1 hypothetical protein [Winogradskyella psychrotolerans]
MTKKIALLLFLGLSMSCTKNDDKPSENHAYLDQLLGRYELRAAYLENPIDLNGDGIAGTDLFQEIEYCNMSKHLESYDCTIIKRNIQEIAFDIPYSNNFNNYQEYSNCLRDKDVGRQINIDSQNESVTLVPNEFEENFMLTYQAKLIDFTWENRIVYLTLEKEFYTPNGEWATVILHMEYEWVSSAT